MAFTSLDRHDYASTGRGTQATGASSRAGLSTWPATAPLMTYDRFGDNDCQLGQLGPLINEGLISLD